MKSWLQGNNDIKNYSTHDKRKSFVAERFIRTLKNKIYKYMTSVSKNLYIDKLDDIVNKDNNTYHSTVKIKTVDIKLSTYIDSSNEIIYEGPKSKIADIVRISKYKNVFAKGYVSNWSDNVSITKVKNTVPRSYIVSDLKGEEIVGKILQKRFAKNKWKRA